MWKIRNECVTETVEAIRSWSSRSRNWSRIAECQFGHNTLRFVWCSNRKIIWTITFLSYNDCREVFYSNKRSNVQIYIRKTLATFCEKGVILQIIKRTLLLVLYQHSYSGRWCFITCTSGKWYHLFVFCSDCVYFFRFNGWLYDDSLGFSFF